MRAPRTPLGWKGCRPGAASVFSTLESGREQSARAPEARGLRGPQEALRGVLGRSRTAAFLGAGRGWVLPTSLDRLMRRLRHRKWGDLIGTRLWPRSPNTPRPARFAQVRGGGGPGRNEVKVAGSSSQGAHSPVAEGEYSGTMHMSM